MKKTKFIITLLIFACCFSINSQTKIEKKAKKVTNEITEVLSLNKAETASIYKIQLARLKESKKIKKEYKEQPQIKKEKLKKAGNKVFNAMKKTLGKERLKKWKIYKSNSKTK